MKNVSPFYGVFAFSISLMSLTGCGGTHAAPDQQKPPAAIVVVSQPVEEEVTDYVDFTGRTDAKESVEIRARVTGFLKEVLFKEGEEIAKDTPLYVIDDREYKADLLAAQGSLGIAQANQDRATSHHNRMIELLKKKAISQDEYDKSDAAKKEADSSVQTAEAKVERAKLNVEFSQIKAPIAGKISRTRVTAGNLVSADTTLLTTIVSVEPMYVYFDVDERTMLNLGKKVREGSIESRKTNEIPVLMGLVIDEGKYPHEGFINFLENRVDSQTGTVRVRGEFQNPRPAKGGRILEAGQFARIRVPIGKPHKALLVTDRAIGTDQGQKFVYIVDAKNEVVFRPVQLGAVHRGLRMIEEGLKPGEKVIIDGLQRVRPGSVVDPKPADMRSRPGGTDAGKSPVAAEADSDGGLEKQHSPSKPAEKH